MPTSYDTATAELAMTLSTLAYVDENRTATQQQMIGEIDAALDEAGYPSWHVVWGPALNADRSNLLYAAQNRQTGELAVSIRGSDFSFWLNWIEDLAALRVVPYKEFVPTAGNTAQIAFGTAVGLRQILRTQDGTESLETFLMAVPDGTPILITGHSLGGCLASVLAPCVADWRGSTSSLAVTRCSPIDPATARPSDSSTVETAVGGKYCQLGEITSGSAVELTGTVVTPFGTLRRPGLNPFENALFLWEAAQQHACTTYQALLQTPLTLPAVGKLEHALAVLELEENRDAQPQ